MDRAFSMDGWSTVVMMTPGAMLDDEHDLSDIRADHEIESDHGHRPGRLEATPPAEAGAAAWQRRLA